VKVIKHLDKYKILPLSITCGNCKQENIQLVEVKNGIAIFNNETYYYSWKMDCYSKPADGIYYVYLIKKQLYQSVETMKPKMAKVIAGFTELLGDTGNFFSIIQPLLAPKETSIVNGFSVSSVSSSKQGIDFNYFTDGRTGLTIDHIEIVDGDKFLITITPKVLYKPVLFYTKEFKQWLANTVFYKEATEWLNNSYNYEIDDDYEYGHYQFNYITYNTEKLKTIVNKHFDLFTKNKYVKSLN
jgi:hypothetical protein